jgi:N-ethylmaleimide reductase
VASSAIALSGQTYTPQGKKPYETPRALDASEIPGIVEDYVKAALRARAAGFDSVEIHGANGYLLDNFLRDGSNKRTDDFGGSIENRARFHLMVVDAVVQAIGSDRTALRLSPVNAFNDMSDSNPRAVFTYMAEQLNKFDLAFLDILEGIPGSMMHVPGDPVAPHIRTAYKGKLVLNGGYLREAAQAALDSGAADAIAIGIPFIANPDLITRLEKDLPLGEAPMKTWYMGLDEGYNDFAALAA